MRGWIASRDAGQVDATVCREEKEMKGPRGTESGGPSQRSDDC